MPARVDSVRVTGDGVRLEVRLPQSLDPDAESRVRGVLFCDDHRRTGSRIGWAAGTALGYIAAAQWLEDERGFRGRLLRVTAVIGGGALGAIAGGLAGTAVGTTRGYPAKWMRAIE